MTTATRPISSTRFAPTSWPAEDSGRPELDQHQRHRRDSRCHMETSGDAVAPDRPRGHGQPAPRIVLAVARCPVTKQMPMEMPSRRPSRAVSAVDRTGLAKRGHNAVRSGCMSLSLIRSSHDAAYETMTACCALLDDHQLGTATDSPPPAHVEDDDQGESVGDRMHDEYVIEDDLRPRAAPQHPVRGRGRAVRVAAARCWR